MRKTLLMTVPSYHIADEGGKMLDTVKEMVKSKEFITGAVMGYLLLALWPRLCVLCATNTH
jgi:hypothetical protein